MEPIVETSEFLADEAATLSFASRFAESLQAPCSVALIGDLGAGKTTFVRGVLRALGVTGAIKSPTYALVEQYGVQTALHGGFDAWHFDFYRLQDASEFDSGGFRDLFASPGLKLVEWPERVAGAAPQADLRIALQAVPGFEARRSVQCTAFTAVGQALL